MPMRFSLFFYSLILIALAAVLPRLHTTQGVPGRLLLVSTLVLLCTLALTPAVYWVRKRSRQA